VRRDVSEPGSADVDRLFLMMAEMAKELSVLADIIEHMSD
jgi:hypothetical protein